ncbi:hypothetical protein SLEP1_g36730 [Rubroshorea leprosula]|uniref:DUF4220 domain-containing protein n=1 Tax=Rubroshorea leprosula TaxID=152421 RepID=A0AAV5KSF5_9ROSI|nr:hypothetical protein SLEP1_g36730 [Rubroshorea leprosula]
MLFPTVIETAKKVWATWNIRGFIIVSLSVQVFLIMLAPFRKWRSGRRGKCLDMLIWSVYLLADWVATFTIGLILSKQIKTKSESSDIYVFWAPFLLLHLGGPDTITSFALEDNEFWVRHLLGLGFQVGSTAYVFVKSLPENKLWLPTLLVSMAGIIKYAERNHAFYLASFDHLGDDWLPSEWGDEIPVPAEFQKMDSPEIFEQSQQEMPLWTAVHLFGTIKMMIVGPLLSPDQNFEIRETFLQVRDSSQVLQIMEIELSLLYEVLHTKLPVVGCLVGYIFRLVTMSCILGAFLLFSLFKKYYKLEQFDMWLTYSLLIGAFVLDIISIVLLISSDWILAAHIRSKDSRFFEKRRWSRAVSQLNFITCFVKDNRSLLKEVADFFRIRRLLEVIKEIRCLSSKDLEVRSEWPFIFEEVKELNEFLNRKMAASSQTVLDAKQVWLYSLERVLAGFTNSNELIKIVKELNYTKSVLTWHIATELCFQRVDQPSTSGEFCKMLSDYMFYLLVMQPATMAAVSVSWKKVFEETLAETMLLVRSSISNEREVSSKILNLIPNFRNPERDINRSVLFAASALAQQLMEPPDGIPWEKMSKVWVHLMCFAAMNCRPHVHAQQPSKGGELLTFVWLLMNHLGIGTHFSSH